MAMESLQVGDGLEDGSNQGPLINHAALLKIEEHVADAKAKGANVSLGGARHSLGGTFYQPTLLTGVTSRMKVANEETFGPLAPLFAFKTEEEVVALANDTPFGLASYFYARDLSRVWRVSEALETGIVAVNTGIFSTEVAPFGGVKESGIGREGSKYGIDEYLEIKYVCIGEV
jgi:succinate-semialdehyde dehydrogenase/glutarate-semialdehyde dehydrogenase